MMIYWWCEMTTWAYLFDRRGDLLDEIMAVFKRSWGINSVGECKFSLPITDPKNIEKNMQFGNWIVVLNDDGLPPWVGRLETPRSWGAKTAKQLAYSAEGIFNNRIGTYIKPHGILNPGGSIFRKLITIANEDEDTLIRPGRIFNGGQRCGTFISRTTILMDNINQILKQSGHEYEIVPVIANNKLTLEGNWYERQGDVVDESLNDRNCKIDEESLSEVGPIINMIYGFGPARPLRINHLAINESSRNKYGLRATRMEINIVGDGPIKALTEMELSRLAWPRRVFRATVSNVDNIYSMLRKGNVLAYENVDAGYGARGAIGTQTYVRIIGMADSGDVEGVAITIIEEQI